MKRPRYAVGKTNGRSAALYFKTLREAEAAILAFSLVDPKGVERGDYYLDAPEEVTNARSFCQTCNDTGQHADPANPGQLRDCVACGGVPTNEPTKGA